MVARWMEPANFNFAFEDSVIFRPSAEESAGALSTGRQVADDWARKKLAAASSKKWIEKNSSNSRRCSITKAAMGVAWRMPWLFHLQFRSLSTGKWAIESSRARMLACLQLSSSLGATFRFYLQQYRQNCSTAGERMNEWIRGHQNFVFFVGFGKCPRNDGRTFAKRDALPTVVNSCKVYVDSFVHLKTQEQKNDNQAVVCSRKSSRCRKRLLPIPWASPNHWIESSSLWVQASNSSASKWLVKFAPRGEDLDTFQQQWTHSM